LVGDPAGGTRKHRRCCVRLLLREPADASWVDRAHYFFARARWELDQLGLAVAQLAALLAPPGADLRVAVDDSVFRRSGRRVHGAGWRHDCSSPARNKLSYGNCFVTAAILVRLPFCSREIGLPVLAHLHCPAKAPGLAGWRPLPPCQPARPGIPRPLVHVVADAGYHGPALRALPGNVTWTCPHPAQRGAVRAGPAAHRQAGPAPHQRSPACGTAHNRVKGAVERTVPFALFAHTLIIIWYACHGHDPADIAALVSPHPSKSALSSQPGKQPLHNYETSVK
jgi:hypothetical protein